MTLFELVKQNICVPDAAEHYGLQVNRNGMCSCPFHEDRHPSMKLNERYFYCFGCGATGDVIDLVARLFDLSSYEAAQKLAQDFGIAPDKPPAAAALPKTERPLLKAYRQEEVRCLRVLCDYLHLLESWKVQYAPKTPEDVLDDRFVEAYQMLDYVEYLADLLIAAELEQRGIRLSSANSINWGRLVPQIVYYFAAYAQLLKAGKIAFGDKVDFCVPTGNFGDILAGYYAKQMGLPVGKLVCASNENNVLTDLLTTGTYTAKRQFFKTTSPSMDILVSSNLERLLYHVTGSDTEVAALMKSLAETGSYTVRPETLRTIQESFACGWSSEEQVAGEIRARYEQDGYLCDTHTAVAFHVAAQKKRSGVPMVVLSTASPFKFPRSVLEALGHTAPQNDFEAMQELEAATGRTAPASLAALRQKAERFNTVIDPEQIAQVALSYQA